MNHPVTPNELASVLELVSDASAPLAFTTLVSDADGAAVLHVDGQATNQLVITITNQTSDEMTVAQLSGTPSAANCNISFALPNSSVYFYIAPTMDASSSPGAWQLATDGDSGEGWVDTIYLATTEDCTLAPNGSEGDTLTLVINYGGAVPDSPTANNIACQVSYQNIETASGLGLQGSTPPQNLGLIANAGEVSPLTGSFVGPATVLNDGTTVSSLTLRLTNTSADPMQFIVPMTNEPTQSYIEVTVPVSDGAEDAGWVLCGTAVWNAIQFSMSGSTAAGWSAAASTTTPGLVVLTPDFTQVQGIPPFSSLELQLTGVTTALGPGIVQVEVSLMRFAQYGTQSFGVPLEKSPLVYNSGPGSGMLLSAGVLAGNSALTVQGDSSSAPLMQITQSGPGPALQVTGGDVAIDDALSAASASLTGALSASSASLGGALTAASAKLGGALQASSVSLSGGVAAATASISGTLSVTGATTSAQLELTDSTNVGNLGLGSRIDFLSAGKGTSAANVSIEENWGLNLYGTSDRPVSVQNANFQVCSGTVTVNANASAAGNTALSVAGGWSIIGAFNTTVDPAFSENGGLAVGWNRSQGQAETNFYNLYPDAATAFQFNQTSQSGTPANLVTILGNGNVGIGTTTPFAPLHVFSWSPAVSGQGTIMDQYIYLDMYQWNSSGGNFIIPEFMTDRGQTQFNDTSILSNGAVAASGFYSFGNYNSGSDARIKTEQGRSDGAADLRTLLAIEITDYRYKDVIGGGKGQHKKLIAQQVESVFPQAVTRRTDVVPDIFMKGWLSDGWVTLANDLGKGERVRLIVGQTDSVHEVLDARPDRFRVNLASADGEVFVYGREVDDFRYLDYNAVAMLNVSATQQIKMDLDAATMALQAEVAELRATLAETVAEFRREIAAVRKGI